MISLSSTCPLSVGLVKVNAILEYPSSGEQGNKKV